MKKYLVLLLLVVSLSSCVSNKELTYFQGTPTSSSEIKRINNVPYKLQIDDILNITITSKNEDIVAVFQKENRSASGASSSRNSSSNNQGYFSDYSVDNYGNIRIPTLGEINVLGYTTLEVRKKIENKITEEYIKKDKSLFVSVKLSGIRYTIIGEINQPGTNIIYQNRVSIIDAVASSGDITDVGNRESVEIIRQSTTGTEKFIVNLTNIDVLNSEVFYIKPNDIINIKPLQEKSWGTGTTGLQSLSTIVSIFTLITSTIILARNL
mgnify:CR=1 FL=1|tara:strand:+ start:1240 stop:2040 length:801 start_codon:yes stop_codon:yes gene_type:complete